MATTIYTNKSGITLTVTITASVQGNPKERELKYGTGTLKLGAKLGAKPVSVSLPIQGDEVIEYTGTPASLKYSIDSIMKRE